MAKRSRLTVSSWFRRFRKLLVAGFGTDPLTESGLSRIGVLTPQGIKTLVPPAEASRRAETVRAAGAEKTPGSAELTEETAAKAAVSVLPGESGRRAEEKAGEAKTQSAAEENAGDIRSEAEDVLLTADEKQKLEELLYDLAAEGKLCVYPDAEDPRRVYPVCTVGGEPRFVEPESLGTPVEMAAAVRGATELVRLHETGRQNAASDMTDEERALVFEENELVGWVAEKLSESRAKENVPEKAPEDSAGRIAEAAGTDDAIAAEAAAEAVKTAGEDAADAGDVTDAEKKEKERRRAKEIADRRRYEEEQMKIMLALIYDRIDGIDMSAPRVTVYMNMATLVRCARADSMVKAMKIAAFANEKQETDAKEDEPWSLFTVSDDVEETVDDDEPSADADEPSADTDEPSADADEPSADADEPSADADEPSADTDKPSADTEVSPEVRAADRTVSLRAAIAEARAQAEAQIKAEHVDPAGEVYLNAVGTLVAADTFSKVLEKGGEVPEEFASAENVSDAGRTLAGTQAFAETAKDPFIRARIALLHIAYDRTAFDSLTADIVSAVEEQAKKYLAAKLAAEDPAKGAVTREKDDTPATPELILS